MPEPRQRNLKRKPLNDAQKARKAERRKANKATKKKKPEQFT